MSLSQEISQTHISKSYLDVVATTLEDQSSWLELLNYFEYENPTITTLRGFISPLLDEYFKDFDVEYSEIIKSKKSKIIDEICSELLTQIKYISVGLN